MVYVSELALLVVLDHANLVVQLLVVVRAQEIVDQTVTPLVAVDVLKLADRLVLKVVHLVVQVALDVLALAVQDAPVTVMDHVEDLAVQIVLHRVVQVVQADAVQVVLDVDLAALDIARDLAAAAELALPRAPQIVLQHAEEAVLVLVEKLVEEHVHLHAIIVIVVLDA